MFLLDKNSEAARYFNIETFENDEDLRVYHSSLRLLDEGYQHMEAFKGVGLVDEHTTLPGVMEFALEIAGVTWVRISAYSLVVRKTPLCNWADVDEKLVELWTGIKASLDLDKLAELEDPRPDPKGA